MAPPPTARRRSTEAGSATAISQVQQLKQFQEQLRATVQQQGSGMAQMLRMLEQQGQSLQRLAAGASSASSSVAPGSPVPWELIQTQAPQEEPKAPQ